MTRSAGSSTRRNARVRCAIYTRKSSVEGFEQEFNSLQAQREACEAFINSQRHEGWVCPPAAYDDGGFSGAAMDRPALQQLLADIAAGRVDLVVYKIDRLTRSLAHFARIVEIIDARGASFVSVLSIPLRPPLQARDQDAGRRDRPVCHSETRCATDQAADQGAPLQRRPRRQRWRTVCCTGPTTRCESVLFHPARPLSYLAPDITQAIFDGR